MYHPFVSKAKRRGAWSILCERGTDDGDTWLYDNAFGDPSQEMTAQSCVLHMPLKQPWISVGPSYGTTVKNHGTNGVDGTLSGELSWITSPVKGPDRFDKREVARFTGGGGLHLTMSQDAPPGSGLNPTGLTSNVFSIGIWYKVANYANSTNERSTLMHVYNKPAIGNSNGLDIKLSLEDYYRPTITVSDGTDTETLECKCGALVGGVEHFETGFYNNSWHYIALSSDGSTLKMYFDGREVDSVALSFRFPTVPDIYTYLNREYNDVALEGFSDISLCHACVWDVTVTEPQFQRHMHSMFRGSDFRANNWETKTFKEWSLDKNSTGPNRQRHRRSDMKYMHRFLMTSTTGENTASEPCRQKPGGDEGEGYTGDYYGEDADNWYCMFADVAGHAQADSPSTAGAAYFCMSEFTGPHTNEHSTYTQHSHFWDDYGQGVSGTSGRYLCVWQWESHANQTCRNHGWHLHREGRTLKVTTTNTEADGGGSYEWEITGSAVIDQGLTWDETAGEFPDYSGLDAVLATVNKTQVDFWWGTSKTTTLADESDHLVMPYYGAGFESGGGKATKGFGPNSGSGTNWECHDRSIHGQIAVFPQQVSEIDYKELRRIGLGQKPMRTRRPTRDLMRHSSLTSPQRGQIE